MRLSTTHQSACIALHNSDVLWHESEINVIDYVEQNNHPDTLSPPHHNSPAQRPFIKVIFSSLLTDPVAQPITTEVENICLNIREAKREQKKLQFYLHTHHRFRCHHSLSLGVCSISNEFTNAINLETLHSKNSKNSTGSSNRISVRSRLLLALNLTSTLLQLKHLKPPSTMQSKIWSRNTSYCLFWSCFFNLFIT